MQAIEQSGWDNVAVNLNGNDNTLTITRHGAELTLFQRHKRQKPIRKDLDLLSPEARSAIPLVGREEELAGLRAWLDGPLPITVRCLVGRGGSGKTRLAIELCARAEAAGWTAGFATYDEIVRFRGQQNLASWRWKGSTLLVVDYAATASRLLRSWLEELAQVSPPKGRKLRLLLLERHADPQLGWWADLTRYQGSSGDVEDLLDPAAPVRLPSLESVDHRRWLLERIMVEASRLHGLPTPLRPPLAGTDPLYERELADDRINNEPLYLLMAGLAAVQNGVPHVLTMRRADLAAKLADAELTRIERLAKASGLDPDLLPHLAAFVTLTDGMGRDDLVGLVRQEQEAMSFPPRVEPGTTARALTAALAGPAPGSADAIRPDLIGEAAVLKAFDRWGRGAAEQAAIVERAWRRAPDKTAAAIVRTAQDFAEPDAKEAFAARVRGWSLAWLDHLIASAPDPGTFLTLAAAMPEVTLSLRERAATIQQQIVDHIRPADDGSEEWRSGLAMSLNSLANRLSALGRREEALAATQEAAGLCRALAAERPDAFRPDLATALGSYGRTLRDLGRREKALAATQEAAGLYRVLAAERPDAFRPDLAMALTNLSLISRELGRREEALAAAQEAAGLYRVLAAERPDAFRPSLAMALNNLGDRLEEAGRMGEGVDYDHEAVALLAPYFHAYPEAIAGQMTAYLRDYLRRAEAAGMEPDSALLGPIMERLMPMLAQAGEGEQT